ncbi:MAG: crossover junction endodeoxyribonuclease RuvC [Candidatus Omnitrophica bacterium]|nr:crossover junction endodeoxyribonuclease RuvC [Candidatus Omnitrophota bacterium]
MRILGIDPGLNRTGYGLIEFTGNGRMKVVEAGVIRTSADSGITQRLSEIYRNVTDVIREHRPEILVLEKLYAHYKHPTTALLMGHARGVVCLACGVEGVPLVSYASTRIKKAVTGNGRAGKHQVQDMVRSMLELEASPGPFDVSDALAMAICYIYMECGGRPMGPGARTVKAAE